MKVFMAVACSLISYFCGAELVGEKIIHFLIRQGFFYTANRVSCVINNQTYLNA